MEETEKMLDPLKALAQNAEYIERVRAAKITLMQRAVTAGYNNTDIGRAIGQSETAVRMFRKRNGITA